MVPEIELMRRKEELALKVAQRRELEILSEDEVIPMPDLIPLSIPSKFMPPEIPVTTCNFSYPKTTKKKRKLTSEEKEAQQRLKNKKDSTTGQESDEIEDEAIYAIIVDYFGKGDKVFSSRHFKEDDKLGLLERLFDEGFSFGPDMFKEVMRRGRKIRDRRAESGITFDMEPNSRHVALNNFDYDRLMKEVDSVEDLIGSQQFTECCPTLSKIISEAEAHENDDYPGRHLPYNNLKGKSAGRYQCLCMLDEILHTAAPPISKNEIENRLGTLSKDKGIKDYTLPSDYALTANYQILSDLISVEFTGSTHKLYGREIYDFSSRNKRCYKKDENGERYTAFKIMLTLDETLQIENELSTLFEHYPQLRSRNPERKFPLLYMMSRLTDKNSGLHQNKLNRTDLVTIDYLPATLSELKKELKLACLNRTPIKISIDGKDEIYYPMNVRTENRDWGLFAIRATTGMPQQFKASVLENNVTILSTDYIQSRQWEEACIIGLSELREDTPRVVTLVLKLNAENKLPFENHRNHPLKNFNLQLGNPPSKTEKARPVTFEVYLNDDFFNMLYDFDYTGNLVDIQPKEIREEYSSFFRQLTGREWKSYDQRNSYKRLKPSRQKE